MAIQACVCVKDLALGAFLRPFIVPAIGLALRGFSDEVNRKADNNDMHSHPEDFELWLLGWWDDQTGLLRLDDGGVRVLSRARDVVTS